jgi:hypothetical protein
MRFETRAGSGIGRACVLCASAECHVPNMSLGAFALIATDSVTPCACLLRCPTLPLLPLVLLLLRHPSVILVKKGKKGKSEAHRRRPTVLLTAIPFSPPLHLSFPLLSPLLFVSFVARLGNGLRLIRSQPDAAGRAPTEGDDPSPASAVTRAACRRAGAYTTAITSAAVAAAACGSSSTRATTNFTRTSVDEASSVPSAAPRRRCAGEADDFCGARQRVRFRRRVYHRTNPRAGADGRGSVFESQCTRRFS